MDGQSTLTPEQVTEVERHKYFMSEKAGHDVGWDFAESDWRIHFDRVRIETTEESNVTACDVAVGESVPASSCCESNAETSVASIPGLTDADVTDADATDVNATHANGTSAVLQRANAQETESSARVGSWFKRLFSKDVS